MQFASECCEIVNYKGLLNASTWQLLLKPFGLKFLTFRHRKKKLSNFTIELANQCCSSTVQFIPFLLVQSCSVTCNLSKQVYFVLRSFHFHDLRVDEALRSFLESFRLPGESPVIEHIMEFFSKQFYVSGHTLTCVMTHIQYWILFTCMTSSR